jgi:hypothetical protein
LSYYEDLSLDLAIFITRQITIKAVATITITPIKISMDVLSLDFLVGVSLFTAILASLLASSTVSVGVVVSTVSAVNSF